MFRRFLIVLITTAIMLATATVLAASGNGKVIGQLQMFGKGNPFAVEDLPPGRTRARLKSLPEQARRRAIEWLHRFAFPANDLDSMVIDNEGAILYVDPAPIDLPAEGEQAPTADGASPDLAASAADDAFLLHSRPGAPNVVFLDFDGHSFSNTAWSSGTIQARPFDLDASPSTFSAAERNAIAEIWHRVAEDYAAFDIDVTTEEPASFGPYTGRVLITSKTQTSGVAMPYNSGGGVAYVNVWGRSDYASKYSPALVYYDNLAKGTTYIAEASAHEFGHNLGLSHDGTSSVTYYKGHGSGATSWAPIMGTSYYNNVTQWSKGEYAGANNTQDDIAIIASKLYRIDDDHGDALNDATPLRVESSGEILVSNPELDPHNIYPENKGVIEISGDWDVFSFDAAAGQVDLTVTPAWDAFYRISKRGANADIQASLLDAGGATLATSDPTSDTYATISLSVPAGTYYLVVSGVGNGNYSDYASTGQYFIAGTIPSGTQNESPTASFGFGCMELSCSFTDSSSDSDGTIASWVWDFGDGASAIAQNPSHTYAGAGAYTVTLTVTDDADATATATQTVTVTIQDVVPPVVTPPADITTQATAVLTPVALVPATTDDGSPVTNDAPAGGFPLGTTTVTWSATDAAGNTGTATQSVTVQDTTPPQLTPPADITIAPGGEIGTATASDIFPVTITNDAPSTFPIGNTIVTWTATDSSGNKTTATQTVTLTNVSPPPPMDGIDFNDYPLSSFSNQDKQGTATIEDGGATLRLVGNRWKRIDFPYTVGPQTVIEFDFYSDTRGEIHGIGLEEDNSLTSGRIFKVYGSQGWGIRDFDNHPGSGWTHYRIPMGQFYTGNMAYLVFVADDDARAAGESRFRNVKVHEGSSSTQGPVVTSPADITTKATAVLTPVALVPATTDDGSPVTNDAPAGGFPLGMTTVTWSATDAAGNTGTATQSVTVQDTTPPQLTPPADITIAPGGEIGTATASDIFPVTITNDAPSTFPIGNTIVTWTATDSSGNKTTATQTVTLTNVSPPPPMDGIDFNDYPLSSFSNQDKQGTATIEDGGATLRLVGNRWKRIDFPYIVGPQTVMEFDFYSGFKGEIHGIGLEEDNSLTSGRIFKVYGSQSWGIRDFDNYPGSGWTHYRIPVGQFYTGNMAYLVFVMDDDARAAGESRFRSVTVYDE